MINPLARFAGQFEVGLGDFARRAAASFADPIKAKGQEVVADVVGAASAAFKGIAIRLAFAVVAVALLVVALVYLVAAIYWALLPSLGPVETRLVLAGLFALLAIAAGVGMLFWPMTAASPAASARHELLAAQEDARRAAAHAAAATAPHAAQADAPSAEAGAGGLGLGAGGLGAGDLRSGVETLATILGEAGFRREQAGLRTGLALAGQLKPMQIASLALIGGYIAGLRYRSRRRR